MASKNCAPQKGQQMQQCLFHRRILEAAKHYGDAIALTDCDTGERLSFGELRRKSVQLAAILQAQFGIGRGQRLLCLLPNCLQYPLILLAGALCGAPISGASPDSGIDDFEVFVAKTGCRAIFAPASHAQLDWLSAKSAALGIHLFLLDKIAGQPAAGIDFNALLEEEEWRGERQIEAFLTTSPDNGLSLDGTFVAPLSSGASGVPKVVLQTHRNFIAATDILKKAIFDELTQTGGGRRATIAAQPFCHASGLWILCYCLLEGHRSLVMRKFNPSLYLSLIEEYKIDTLSLGPWLISLLLQQNLAAYNLSSVRTIISGGSSEATNAAQNGRFLGHFPAVDNFLIGYGMTEIVLISHITPLHMDPGDGRRLHSVGKLLPGFHHKIVDCLSGEDITGQANARGELWLRSDCVMAGYLGEPELTGKTIIEGQGWFRTGDVLWKDAEGFFFYVDRLANLVLVNGREPVWPAELESVLLAHPAVMDACVIGEGTKEEEDGDQLGQGGEVPMAFLVLRGEKMGHGHGAKLEQIRQFANARLNAHQRIRRGAIFAVESLPKTPFGKVAKQKVRATMKGMMGMGEEEEEKDDKKGTEEKVRKERGRIGEEEKYGGKEVEEEEKKEENEEEKKEEKKEQKKEGKEEDGIKGAEEEEAKVKKEGKKKGKEKEKEDGGKGTEEEKKEEEMKKEEKKEAERGGEEEEDGSKEVVEEKDKKEGKKEEMDERKWKEHGKKGVEDEKEVRRTAEIITICPEEDIVEGGEGCLLTVKPANLLMPKTARSVKWAEVEEERMDEVEEEEEGDEEEGDTVL